MSPDSVIRWLNLLQLSRPCRRAEDLKDGELLLKLLAVMKSEGEMAGNEGVRDSVTIEEVRMLFLGYASSLPTFPSVFLSQTFDTSLPTLLELAFVAASHSPKSSLFLEKVVALDETTQSELLNTLLRAANCTDTAVSALSSALISEVSATRGELHKALECLNSAESKAEEKGHLLLAAEKSVEDYRRRTLDLESKLRRCLAFDPIQPIRDSLVSSLEASIAEKEGLVASLQLQLEEQRRLSENEINALRDRLEEMSERAERLDRDRKVWGEDETAKRSGNPASAGLSEESEPAFPPPDALPTLPSQVSLHSAEPHVQFFVTDNSSEDSFSAPSRRRRNTLHGSASGDKLREVAILYNELAVERGEKKRLEEELRLVKVDYSGEMARLEADVRANRARSDRQAQELRDKAETLGRELEEVTRTAQSEKADLAAKLKYAEMRLRQLSEECKVLKKEKEELTGEIRSLRTQKEDLTSQYILSREQELQIMQSLSEVQILCQEKENEVETLRKKVDSAVLQGDVDTPRLRSHALSLERKILALESELAQSQVRADQELRERVQ